jgi:hypothetical protein
MFHLKVFHDFAAVNGADGAKHCEQLFFSHPLREVVDDEVRFAVVNS